MKTKVKRLPTWFEPETRFDVAPVAAVPFRGTGETELEQLKNKLLRAALQEAPDPEFYIPLRRAATEAAGVAWMTPFPRLFFPVLFDEKVALAKRQFARARNVRVRSQRILAEVF
jgi:hypothetical protein